MTVAAATVEIPAPGEVRRRPYRVAELAERWDIDVSNRVPDDIRRCAARRGARPARRSAEGAVDAVAEYERAATVPAAGCPAPAAAGARA